MFFTVFLCSRFFRLTFVAFYIFTNVQSSQITCSFKNQEFWQLGSLYGCLAKVNLDENQNVNEISGAHAAGKTNEDVKGIKFEANSGKLLPTGIDVFFPFLEAIVAELSKDFIKVSREDFAPFRRLRQVHIYGNKIQELDSDLFISNPLIAHISFGGNPLKHIGHRTFESLKELASIYLVSANCINNEAQNNRPGVLKIMQTISVNCPPSSEMIIKEVLESDEFKLRVEQEMSEKTSPLAWKLFQIEEKMSKIEKCCIQG